MPHRSESLFDMILTGQAPPPQVADMQCAVRRGSLKGVFAPYEQYSNRFGTIFIYEDVLPEDKRKNLGLSHVTHLEEGDVIKRTKGGNWVLDSGSMATFGRGTANHARFIKKNK